MTTLPVFMLLMSGEMKIVRIEEVVKGFVCWPPWQHVFIPLTGPALNGRGPGPEEGEGQREAGQGK